jgi:hypothetical protein
MDISLEKFDQACGSLASLPVKPKTTATLREGVYRLRHQLNKALRRGYSYEDLAEALKKSEIEISPETLKQYLSQANNRKSSKKKKSVFSVSSSIAQVEAATEFVSEPLVEPVLVQEVETVVDAVKKKSTSSSQPKRRFTSASDDESDTDEFFAYK